MVTDKHRELPGLPLIGRTMGKYIWAVFSEPVPYEFQPTVCSCKEPGWGADRLDKCSNCSKFHKYHLNRCTECGQHYIDRYYHTGRCRRIKECFDCCSTRAAEQDGCQGDCEVCGHRSRFAERYNIPDLTSKIYLPEELLPRKMRDHAEVLAEDFSLDLDF